MSRLENKVVLISGGASGIGAATARLVVREGGKAVLADRDEAKGRALAGELGDAALFVPLDVTDEAAWNKAVAATVDKFGGLHGLLNAAGVGVRNSIEDCTLAEYRRVNDINGLGTFLGCKAAIPAMKKAGRRLDRQHLLGARPARRLLRDGLLRQQGRGAALDQARGAALRADEVQHPLQLGASGLHRHADDRAAARPAGRQHERPAMARGAASAGPPRPPRGGRRHDPVPAVGRELFLDRLGIRLRRRADGLSLADADRGPDQAGAIHVQDYVNACR